ncbi:MAG: protein of unknown function transrane [Clostridia bacterium]|nr:protein of unknown function transrane [Clostridia bacterium]
MNPPKHISILYAILAAALYSISIPICKVLINEIPPTFMAALLYLGAGIGMFFIYLIQKNQKKGNKEASLTKTELPFIIGMIVLDIAAPIFLILGLTMTASANASLLNNFEIVATSFIAYIIFKESITKHYSFYLLVFVGVLKIIALECCR